MGKNSLCGRQRGPSHPLACQAVHLGKNREHQLACCTEILIGGTVRF